MNGIDLSTAFAVRHLAGAVAHVAWATAASVAVVTLGRVALAWLGARAGWHAGRTEARLGRRLDFGRMLARPSEIPGVELS